MLKDPERAAVAPKLPPMGRLVRPEEVAGADRLPAPRAGGRHCRPADRDLRRRVVALNGAAQTTSTMTWQTGFLPQGC